MIAATARACPPTLREVDGDIAEVVNAMVKNIDGVVKGKHHEIRMAMCCMLTEGHLLLDDVPGTGKTTLAKAIAGSIAIGYTNGHEETVRAGDLFYLPPGHTAKTDEGVTFVEFSPARELQEVYDHVSRLTQR